MKGLPVFSDFDDLVKYFAAFMVEAAKLYSENRILRSAGQFDNAVFSCFIDDLAVHSTRLSVLKEARIVEILGLDFIISTVINATDDFLFGPVAPMRNYAVSYGLDKEKYEQAVRERRALFIDSVCAAAEQSNDAA